MSVQLCNPPLLPAQSWGITVSVFQGLPGETVFSWNQFISPVLFPSRAGSLPRLGGGVRGGGDKLTLPRRFYTASHPLPPLTLPSVYMTLGAEIHWPMSGHTTVRGDALAGSIGNNWLCLPLLPKSSQYPAPAWYRVGLKNGM